MLAVTATRVGLCSRLCLCSLGVGVMLCYLAEQRNPLDRPAVPCTASEILPRCMAVETWPALWPAAALAMLAAEISQWGC
ncbi:hypothetical protein COO60DRAFT_571362 [Scenedesmus sp. NREL 46B-D3]|nr:hypothetical protein COO60DRAFT_571362 [Scenedesmus sp. NREL 46B-D3]